MKITVASYNIRHAADAGFDMKLLASAALSVGADVIGVQEMDINADRSGNRNQLEEFKAALGFEYGYFLKCVGIKTNGDYGTAILSRFPITDVKTYKLYKGERCEQRMLGVYTLDVGGESLTFANTHLDYVSREAIRKQMEETDTYLSSEERFIMTGDFNTGDMSLFEKIGNAKFLMNECTRLVTFPENSSTIDNIVMRGEMKVTSFGTVEKSHSDHFMLWCEIEF